MMSNEIGKVVEVHGSYVKIELDPGQRSPVRASVDGADTHIKINAYVTLDLGAGDSVLGIITDLSAREYYEPSDEELTLELARPRRVAVAQLLGTICARGQSEYKFDPGVNVLPTLDTPALPARPEILKAVLEDAPVRNCPRDWGKETRDYDGKLLMGTSTSARERSVHGSYNDLLSRPLAVVGNTGSGKSCTIAHLLQEAIKTRDPEAKRPRFFVLDINGEYAQPFGKPVPKGGREPNRIYFDGKEATVPVWLMNAAEVCQWLSAAEQMQQPALVNLWALAKGAALSDQEGHVGLRYALIQLEVMTEIANEGKGRTKGWNVRQCWEAAQEHATCLNTESSLAPHVRQMKQILDPVKFENRWDKYDRSFGSQDKAFRVAVKAISDDLEAKLGSTPMTIEQTADKPVHFPVSKLDNPSNLEAAAELSPGDRSIRQFLQGLQLRIQNRRNDKRWHAFYNYDALGITSAAEWFSSLGIGKEESDPVTVIDCSMISHDVLPYVCGVVGRMLLELREHVLADARFHDPWVVVLEEAHSYVRPSRQDEDRGIAVSRETFERIAKEGRKFGLSLIVASQRPSDVSPTVMSQCANFVVHRLQNPDDIDHFRKIVPAQSRRLMDQITILRAGESIVAGSGFSIPSRVQIEKPDPEPTSISATPYVAWQASMPAFGADSAFETWGIKTEPNSIHQGTNALETTPLTEEGK